ncbi:MAG: hypothetical protein U0166_18895 [Acidobacteriota bacterium]
MDERSGTTLLRRHFEAVGLAIEEGYRFQAEGIDLSLDGFDPARRVGYEYVTTEAGDRAELTPGVVARLEEMMQRGELYVLLLDEREAVSEHDLSRAADLFLGELRKRGFL